MKEAINQQGDVVTVTKDTPVKTVNGKHYLLAPQDKQEIAQRNAEWQAKAQERNVLAIRQKRKAEYGTVEEQLEFIAENGFQAWIDKINSIKAKYPIGGQNGN